MKTVSRILITKNNQTKFSKFENVVCFCFQPEKLREIWPTFCSELNFILNFLHPPVHTKHNTNNVIFDKNIVI